MEVNPPVTTHSKGTMKMKCFCLVLRMSRLVTCCRGLLQLPGPGMQRFDSRKEDSPSVNGGGMPVLY